MCRWLQSIADPEVFDHEVWPRTESPAPNTVEMSDMYLVLVLDGKRPNEKDRA